ncbi:peptidoglycan DD-metalloendopeptidase family protein [Legionella spiritensis]|uniref:M23/M37 family transporter peptidase n=1 Tax=Legionella spiritensis TaxID=452 RepID=A0A0W0Z801_LEGSP|nr:peptidoglycan DD-metalloendopeptidase family protein [Legionella spiritensis]KTD65244.1 M23/M37 family transporter peptidase [Legionella spiritensis]SNV30326.1 peptidase, M23/M37 family [Legionella spiritensis]
MAHRPNASLNKPARPSKLLALIALVIAFALPFILVKSFSHKQHSKFTSRTLALPKTNDKSDERESGFNHSEEPMEEAPVEAIEATPSPSTDKEVTSARNGSVIPSTANTEKSEKNWEIIKTKSGDSLASVFNRLGLSAKTLNDILKDNPHATVLSKLKPNQEIQFLVARQTLEKMILPLTSTQFLVVYRNGEHYKSKINTRKMNSHNHFVTATVAGSLYGTAKRHNIPYKLIRQMEEIFNWEINFSRDIRAGDQFTILYKAFYIEDKLVGTGDILAVSYKNHGHVFQAVRHTSRNGQTDYYTPQGTSLKKAFNRYPVRFSHISSTFNLSRYHPVLHYRRAHRGVDLAARIGTPITATGDGRIAIIGRQNGYGNMIKITHNKTYSTIYGHMLKFQKGLSKGDFVKRGQVIGYVGQSGLANGPHCHYEFRINDQPKNPTTIPLPQGESVPGKEMATFKANTNTLLAQLKLFEEGNLASKSVENKRKNG